ncbi:hypothetical protein [Candidatus Magnetobacterium casense]|nr:hypothetical protein [Candidatus Magnetobacterium casensis]
MDNRGKILREISENLKEIGRVDINEDKTSIVFPKKKLRICPQITCTNGV